MTDFNVRRKRADAIRSQLDGKVTKRVAMAAARGALFGEWKKPLDELTDAEILAEPGIGPGTLADIRSVIPAPE